MMRLMIDTHSVSYDSVFVVYSARLVFHVDLIA